MSIDSDDIAALVKVLDSIDTQIMAIQDVDMTIEKKVLPVLESMATALVRIATALEDKP